jgi:hypothetical protein
MKKKNVLAAKQTERLKSGAASLGSKVRFIDFEVVLLDCNDCQPGPTCWVGWSDCSRGGIWSETTRKTHTVRGMHLVPWHAPVKTHAAVRRSS